MPSSDDAERLDLLRQRKQLMRRVEYCRSRGQSGQHATAKVRLAALMRVLEERYGIKPVKQWTEYELHKAVMKACQTMIAKGVHPSLERIIEAIGYSDNRRIREMRDKIVRQHQLPPFPPPDNENRGLDSDDHATVLANIEEIRKTKQAPEVEPVEILEVGTRSTRVSKRRVSQ